MGQDSAHKWVCLKVPSKDIQETGPTIERPPNRWGPRFGATSPQERGAARIKEAELIPSEPPKEPPKPKDRAVHLHPKQVSKHACTCIYIYNIYTYTYIDIYMYVCFTRTVCPFGVRAET